MPASPLDSERTSVRVNARSATPSTSATCCSVIVASPTYEISWSHSDSASRTLPPLSRTSRLTAFGSIASASAPKIRVRCWPRRDAGTSLKSYRWQRDRIVVGIFSGSVVARMNFTWLGGSSSVLSNALNELLESMCTSSIM